MKIQTLRGTSIKGKHYDKYTIVDCDEEDAKLCVGSGAARFVLNEELAQKENAKMKKADADASKAAADGAERKADSK